MTEHEKYQEHIRHTHDAFCKTVIRHAAIDAARSIRSRRKREISLEYLIEEKHYPFSTTDKYFAEQSGMTSYPLFVCGQMVLLESPELAAALSALSRMEQEIIFLYYFQRLTHREIGRRYGRAGNTTGRRINIYGGSITACSTTGDGFDSNGGMTFAGGTVAVWTANTADNEPLDADGTITVTGGTILAAGGSSGMGMSIDAQQAYVTFGESAGMGGPGGGQRPDDGDREPPEMGDGTELPERPEQPE